MCWAWVKGIATFRYIFKNACHIALFVEGSVVVRIEMLIVKPKPTLTHIDIVFWVFRPTFLVNSLLTVLVWILEVLEALLETHLSLTLPRFLWFHLSLCLETGRQARFFLLKHGFHERRLRLYIYLLTAHWNLKTTR